MIDVDEVYTLEERTLTKDDESKAATKKKKKKTKKKQKDQLSNSEVGVDTVLKSDKSHIVNKHNDEISSASAEITSDSNFPCSDVNTAMLIPEKKGKDAKEMGNPDFQKEQPQHISDSQQSLSGNIQIDHSDKITVQQSDFHNTIAENTSRPLDSGKEKSRVIYSHELSKESSISHSLDSESSQKISSESGELRTRVTAIVSSTGEKEGNRNMETEKCYHLHSGSDTEEIKAASQNPIYEEISSSEDEFDPDANYVGELSLERTIASRFRTSFYAESTSGQERNDIAVPVIPVRLSHQHDDDLRECNKCKSPMSMNDNNVIAASDSVIQYIDEKSPSKMETDDPSKNVEGENKKTEIEQCQNLAFKTQGSSAKNEVEVLVESIITESIINENYSPVMEASNVTRNKETKNDICMETTRIEPMDSEIKVSPSRNEEQLTSVNFRTEPEDTHFLTADNTEGSSKMLQDQIVKLKEEDTNTEGFCVSASSARSDSEYRQIVSVSLVGSPKGQYDNDQTKDLKVIQGSLARGTSVCQSGHIRSRPDEVKQNQLQPVKSQKQNKTDELIMEHVTNNTTDVNQSPISKELCFQPSPPTHSDKLISSSESSMEIGSESADNIEMDDSGEQTASRIPFASKKQKSRCMFSIFRKKSSGYIFKEQRYENLCKFSMKGRLSKNSAVFATECRDNSEVNKGDGQNIKANCGTSDHHHKLTAECKDDATVTCELQHKLVTECVSSTGKVDPDFNKDSCSAEKSLEAKFECKPESLPGSPNTKVSFRTKVDNKEFRPEENLGAALLNVLARKHASPKPCRTPLKSRDSETEVTSITADCNMETEQEYYDNVKEEREKRKTAFKQRLFETSCQDLTDNIGTEDIRAHQMIESGLDFQTEKTLEDNGTSHLNLRNIFLQTPELPHVTTIGYADNKDMEMRVKQRNDCHDSAQMSDSSTADSDQNENSEKLICNAKDIDDKKASDEADTNLPNISKVELPDVSQMVDNSIIVTQSGDTPEMKFGAEPEPGASISDAIRQTGIAYVNQTVDGDNSLLIAVASAEAKSKTELDPKVSGLAKEVETGQSYHDMDSSEIVPDLGRCTETEIKDKKPEAEVSIVPKPKSLEEGEIASGDDSFEEGEIVSSDEEEQSALATEVSEPSAETRPRCEESDDSKDKRHRSYGKDQQQEQMAMKSHRSDKDEKVSRKERNTAVAENRHSERKRSNLKENDACRSETNTSRKHLERHQKHLKVSVKRGKESSKTKKDQSGEHGRCSSSESDSWSRQKDHRRRDLHDSWKRSSRKEHSSIHSRDDIKEDSGLDRDEHSKGSSRRDRHVHATKIHLDRFHHCRTWPKSSDNESDSSSDRRQKTNATHRDGKFKLPDRNRHKEDRNSLSKSGHKESSSELPSKKNEQSRDTRKIHQIAISEKKNVADEKARTEKKSRSESERQVTQIKKRTENKVKQVQVSSSGKRERDSISSGQKFSKERNRSKNANGDKEEKKPHDQIKSEERSKTKNTDTKSEERSKIRNIEADNRLKASAKIDIDRQGNSKDLDETNQNGSRSRTVAFYKKSFKSEETFNKEQQKSKDLSEKSEKVGLLTEDPAICNKARNKVDETNKSGENRKSDSDLAASCDRTLLLQNSKSEKAHSDKRFVAKLGNKIDSPAPGVEILHFQSDEMDPTNESTPFSTKGLVKGLVYCKRHVNQLFIRGDNVVMVAYESM